MQKGRPVCQIFQIRNAPTTTIQNATKTTTKLPGTATAEEQPSGYKTDITKDEEHTWRRSRRHSRNSNETRDLESTCYIREMMEDLQNTANFIQSVQFTYKKVTDTNKTKKRRNLDAVKKNNKQIYWLADTGSPRSFMNIQTDNN